ncbi:MAG: hypothetical protein Q4F69_11245 [Bacteroidia bacterium]|nr:hypothetical protein [Bacteroidia bacterium]
MAAAASYHENDSVRIDSTLVRYFYDKIENQQLGDIKVWDTTTLGSTFYDSADPQFQSFHTLSNSGHAHENLEFSFPTSLGFNDKLPAFNQYLISKEDIFYPIVYQPFTCLKYMMGRKKEQHFNATFSREMMPRFYLTMFFNIDDVPSFYKRSYAQDINFWINLRWNTKNNRYGVNGYYFTNKIYNYESGGLKNEQIFIDNIEPDKTLLDVNLQNATNLIKTSGFGINQHFVLSKNKSQSKNDKKIVYDTIFVKDTINGSIDTIVEQVKEKRHIGLGRINYSIDYQRNRYLYEDGSPNSEFYAAFDTLLDGSFSHDSLCFNTIKNAISWNSLSYKEYSNDIPFYLTFGAEHNYTVHHGYRDYVTGQQFGKEDHSNIRAKAGIIINLFKSTRITGNGELIFAGYQAGDFFIDAQWKQFLGTYTKNIGALKFDFNLARKSPDWFETYYYSNNFRWENDFGPASHLMLKGSYEFRWFDVGVKNRTISNYIYFAENAKPAQYSGTLDVLSLFAKFDFKFRIFEVSGIMSMQKANNEDVVHLPAFYGKVKMGLNITLVKNISSLQPSVVVNYFTEYYADAYMPATRTYHLQNEVKIGNYPFVDIFLTFKLHRTNIYFGITNIFSFTNDNRYFSTPHYPTRDYKLLLGVNWKLYK